MPKAKKSVSQQVTKMSEQMNAMLVVFALAMLALAYVLVTVYTR